LVHSETPIYVLAPRLSRLLICSVRGNNCRHFLHAASSPLPTRHYPKPLLACRAVGSVAVRR
jgi:hypothetical protein